MFIRCTLLAHAYRDNIVKWKINWLIVAQLSFSAVHLYNLLKTSDYCTIDHSGVIENVYCTCAVVSETVSCLCPTYVFTFIVVYKIYVCIFARIDMYFWILLSHSFTSKADPVSHENHPTPKHIPNICYADWIICADAVLLPTNRLVILRHVTLTTKSPWEIHWLAAGVLCWPRFALILCP